MRAAVSRGIGQIGIEELDEPEPRTGEVKLQMVATGVCCTDLSILQGHLPSPRPIVLGHEGAGIVCQVGPGVSGLAVGDPVICTIIPSCGRCFYCARGEDPLCEEITVYTGLMLAALSAAVIDASLIALALSGCLVVALWLKSMVEEQWLAQRYPGYAAYRARTGRFLPRVGRSRT